MKKFKKGIYTNKEINNEMYFKLKEYHNRSNILKIEDEDIESILEGESEDASALRIGNAIHALWLEKRCEYDVHEKTARSKGVKEDIEEARKQGKLMLAKDEDELVKKCVEALNNCEEACEILKNAKAVEQTILTDNYNGLPAKVRLDILSSDDYIYDLKTTSKALTKKDLRSAFFTFAYNLQASMYTDITKQFIEKVKGFRFIFVSKKTFEVKIVKIENFDFARSEEKLRKLCKQFQDELTLYTLQNMTKKKVEIELFEKADGSESDLMSLFGEVV